MRIAFEIKAMLEHVDHSIERVEGLAVSSIVHREYAEYGRIASVIDLLNRHWEKNQLPINDVLRLARNIEKILGLLNIELDALDAALAAEASRGAGPLLQDLSPYGAILQTIFSKFGDHVRTPGRAPPRSPIIVSSQVEIPATLGGLDPRYFKLV
jgi:hypothetical protein